MKVFFDCNVWLDVGLPNAVLEPGSRSAFQMCARDGHDLFLAWHTLSNVFYVMRKKHGQANAERFVTQMIQSATVAAVAHPDAAKAAGYGVADFEDALQMAAAESCAADIIVTRNASDFKISSIPVYTPEDFVAAFTPSSPAP